MARWKDLRMDRFSFRGLRLVSRRRTAATRGSRSADLFPESARSPESGQEKNLFVSVSQPNRQYNIQLQVY